MPLGDNQPDILSSIKARHRGLAILRALASSPAYISNERVLGDYLDRLGLGSGDTELRGCLTDLERDGAITIAYERSLMVLSLTRRGEEVARGVQKLETVASPGPDCPY